MIQFQENTQTNVIPATTMCLTIKTAKNWHLKVKRRVYNVGLKKISLIQKLIQQILGSHELNGHTQF